MYAYVSATYYVTEPVWISPDFILHLITVYQYMAIYSLHLDMNKWHYQTDLG